MIDFINSKNENLYNEIIEKTSIELIEFSQWGSITENNNARIFYTKTVNPYACFTHELLHIKYYHLGLKCPKFIDNETLEVTITFLFNQLSHHKFFEEFCSLGFDEKNFLDNGRENEFNDKTIKYINKLEGEFAKKGKIELDINLLMLYISLKSPNDSSEKTLNYINRLKLIGGKNFFLKIDLILEDWRKETTLNSCSTLAKLYKTCNYTNIGFYLDNRDEIIYANSI